ncbi:MAG: hypothetical protein ABJA82_01675 [Myxococcales bacterium]
MARPRPFIIACLGAGALIVGAEVTAIYRSRHRTPAAPTEVATEAATEVAPPPAAAPTEFVASSPAPRLAAPPPPPPITPPPPAPEPSEVASVDAAARRPLFVAPDIETVIHTADEEAFQKLDLPDATRAAIRRINEEHAQKLHLLRAGEGAVANEQQLKGNSANVAAFKQTRRAALQELLGADTEMRFERAEHAATRHLHNQFRVQSLGGVSPSLPAPTLP